MEHLRKYLTELQSLETEIVTSYKLKDGSEVPESEYVEGMDYSQMTERVAIQNERYTNDYRQYILDLSNKALLDYFLLNKEQSERIFARFSAIEETIEECLTIINDSSSNLNENLFHFREEFELLFPFTTSISGKPHIHFFMYLNDVLVGRKISVRRMQSAIISSGMRVVGYSNYGYYKPEKIKDPYLIIDCCGYGIYKIKQLFKEQLQIQYALPKERKAGKTYSKKDMLPMRVIRSYEIAQELPFIDLRLFKKAVRKLLFNISNRHELEHILKPVYDTAKENIDLYVDHVRVLEQLYANPQLESVPEEYKDLTINKETSHYILSDKFRTTYISSSDSLYFRVRKPQFFINRDLAAHSESVLLLLNREVYNSEPLEEKVPEKLVDVSKGAVSNIIEIIGGYFDNQRLLKEILLGSPVREKVTFNSTTKFLCKIFKYLHQQGVVKGESSAVQAWLVTNFNYVYKNKSTAQKLSTVTRNFEERVYETPIAGLESIS